MHLIDIADTAVMLPLAGAIAGWLVAGRAWKLAGYWCLLFGMGLGIVAMSKILFIGWAVGIPALDFKALSGHTLRATVVLPALSVVMLQSAPIHWRTAGLVLAVAFSIVIGMLLVRFGFHTVSEVIATAILGGLISFVFLRIAATLPPPHVNGWMAPLSLVAFVLIFSLKPSSMSHRLVDVALYLSDRDHPYTWSQKIDRHCLSTMP